MGSSSPIFGVKIKNIWVATSQSWWLKSCTSWTVAVGSWSHDLHGFQYIYIYIPSKRWWFEISQPDNHPGTFWIEGVITRASAGGLASVPKACRIWLDSQNALPQRWWQLGVPNGWVNCHDFGYFGCLVSLKSLKENGNLVKYYLNYWIGQVVSIHSWSIAFSIATINVVGDQKTSSLLAITPGIPDHRAPPNPPSTKKSPSGSGDFILEDATGSW